MIAPFNLATLPIDKLPLEGYWLARARLVGKADALLLLEFSPELDTGSIAHSRLNGLGSFNSSNPAQGFAFINIDDLADIVQKELGGTSRFSKIAIADLNVPCWRVWHNAAMPSQQPKPLQSDKTYGT